MDEVFRIMPKEDLYARTGIQFLQFNTLFQLYAAKRDGSRAMSLARDTGVLRASLEDLLGADAVTAAPEELACLSSDVYSTGTTAALALRPNSRERLPEAIRQVTEAGFALTARGGGMSYTGGYLPVRDRTVVLDLSALNAVQIDTGRQLALVQPGTKGSLEYALERQEEWA